MDTEIHEQLICLFSRKASRLWNGKNIAFVLVSFPFSLQQTVETGRRTSVGERLRACFAMRREKSQRRFKSLWRTKIVVEKIAEEEMLIVDEQIESRKLFFKLFVRENTTFLLRQGKGEEKSFYRQPQHARTSVASPSNH